MTALYTVLIPTIVPILPALLWGAGERDARNALPISLPHPGALVEMRARIPVGQGIWPAFWMLGVDIDSAGGPRSGEIDIMENTGKEPCIVYGMGHGPGYSSANGIGARSNRDLPPVEYFRVYRNEYSYADKAR